MKTILVREVEGEIEQKSYRKPRVKKSDFRHRLFFESYGVRISVVSNTAGAIEEARKIISENLPNCFEEIGETDIEHHFLLVRNPSEKDTLYKNGEKIMARTNRKDLIEFFGSQIRLTVAEFAVGRVFVHAGVISWKDKSIVIPGYSFSGKTALTAALVKRGAIYYSDECAVLDEDGFVHPFPKKLSIRGEIDDYTQVDYSVEELGGTAGMEKTRISMVLITDYKSGAKWNPVILSRTKGIMEIIKHTAPIRQNPEFTLKVLNQVADHAIIVKSRRGDISESVDSIIDFFETACFKS